MDEGGVPQQVTDAVLVASRALVAVSARSLAVSQEKVTLVQLRALVVLSTISPVSLGDFAGALGVHPSSATRLCDRLVARGLVRRNRSRDSRREIQLSLSATGQQLVDDVTAYRRAEIAEILAVLPAGEADGLVGALNAFVDAAQKVLGQTWPEMTPDLVVST